MNRSMLPLLAALGCVAVDGHAQVANEYTYTALPMHEVYGINDSGIAVGGTDLNREAVAYVQGQLIRLQAPGYTSTLATAISDAGHIVGYGNFNGETHALFWQSYTSAPIRITGPGDRLRPTSVNSQGVVVGTRDLDGTGFKWSITAGMTPLGALGSSFSNPAHIADSGYVAGTVSFNDRGNIARWSPTGGSGIVEWGGTVFKAMNDGGILGWDAQGWSSLWSVSNTRTFLPSTYRVTDMSAKGRLIGYEAQVGSFGRALTQPTPNATASFLPLPPGATGARIYDVNSCGTIIGSTVLSPTSRQAAMWTRSTCDVQTTAVVPEVRGFTLEQAAPVLMRSNVFAGRTNYVVGPCNDVNRITRQSPGGGMNAPTASSVELSVVVNCSVAVPGLRGQTISGASATLQSVGLVLGTVKSAVDNSCNYIGAVMSQIPTSGALNWGSAVNVTIGQRPRTACP